MKPLAIICDLDGTLYDARDRQEKYLLSGKKDFDGFHRAAKDDKPHIWCVELLHAFSHRGVFTIFSSGRDDAFRGETVGWLLQHLNWRPHTHYRLFMRKTGDYTADDTMKERWLDEIRQEYNVLCAIDDRKRVADMWRRNGITCLQCDEGNF